VKYLIIGTEKQFLFLESLEEYKTHNLMSDDMNKLIEKGYQSLFFKGYPLTFIDDSNIIPKLKGFKNIFIGDLGNNISKWIKRLYSNQIGLQNSKPIKDYTPFSYS